jgi:hypothetical protein
MFPTRKCCFQLKILVANDNFSSIGFSS